MTEAVIYQSVLDSGRPYQQLSNLMLDGLSTHVDYPNTDAGRLYGSLTKQGSVYQLDLYKDILKTEKVCHGSGAVGDTVALTADNASGLTGSFYLAQYLADDTSIEAVCFLSSDADLPLNNLEAVSDYDQSVGFARFHLDAFSYLRDFVISRYKTLVFNPDYLDSRSINGGKGGYDLSRVLNWSSLKEASAHYALLHILEKQYIEPGSTFDVRSKESRNIVKAHLASVELRFDTDLDRVENKSRSLSTWKIVRS